MGTKNDPGKFDCYANAEPDEPMFVLLARDKHAPTLVWLWAAMRELDGEPPEVTAEARECVVAMIEWAVSKGKRPVGLGQSVLVGVMELIRTVNGAVANAKNAPTGDEVMRRALAFTEVETLAEGEAS